MRFRFDEDVAAFGLFHLAFASLEQELATTLFLIRQIDDASVTFEGVRRLGIVELKRDLTRELKQLSEVDLDAQTLRNICSKIGALNAWRRERVHARVRIDEQGIAIFNAKTLKHLPIHRDECVQKIEEAVSMANSLRMHTRGLLPEIESRKKWRELFDEMYSTIEAAEIEPE